MTRTSQRRIAALAAVVFACALPATSYAQAWLPAQGEGSVSIGFQAFDVNWHLELDGSEQEELNVNVRNVMADVTYGLTERLAIDASIPYVSSKYGPLGHPCSNPIPAAPGGRLEFYYPCAFPESEIDDGEYYRSFQDFRLNVRYAVLNRGLALTPSVSYLVPMSSYPTLGHAAPGRHLEELGLGLHAGKLLTRSANTYVHASYVYTIPENVVHHGLDVDMNRSNAEIELGHQLTPSLSVRGLSAWQRTHGGLEWTEDLFAEDSEHSDIHDVAARASYWRLAAGIVYAVNDSVAIDLSALTTMSGKNTHKIGGFIAGTTWTFGRGGGLIGVPQPPRRPVRARP